MLDSTTYAASMSHWNMTEQIPNTFFVQSTRRKHRRQVEVLGVPFRFVIISASRFFGIAQRTLDGKSFYVTSSHSGRIVTRWRLRVNVPETWRSGEARR